jgi:hypothetical protein
LYSLLAVINTELRFTRVRGLSNQLGYAEQTLKLAKKALSPGAARYRNHTPLAALPRCGC